MSSVAELLDALQSAIERCHLGAVRGAEDGFLSAVFMGQSPEVPNDPNCDGNDLRMQYLELQENRIQAIAARIRMHRNWLSKVYILPDDVLFNIFRRLPQWTNLALSHTSSRFRNILLQYPLLWSEVLIPEKGMHPGFLEAIVLRSQQTQIYLAITFPADSSHLSYDRLMKNVVHCAVFLPRLVSLGIQLPHSSISCLSALDWLKSETPALHTLELRHDNDSSPYCYELPALFKHLLPSPNLKTLCLHGYEIIWPSEAAYTGSPGLTQLKISNARIQQECIVTIFRACKSLRRLSSSRCCIWGNHGLPMPTMVNSPIAMPNLRHLFVRISPPEIECRDWHLLNMLELHPKLNITVHIITRSQIQWCLLAHTRGDPMAIAAACRRALVKTCAACAQSSTLYMRASSLRGRTEGGRTITFCCVPRDPEAAAQIGIRDLMADYLADETTGFPSLLKLSIEAPFTPRFPVTFCGRLLMLADNLAILELQDCSRSELVEVWNELKKAQDASAPFCRSLQGIVLRNCTVDIHRLFDFLRGWQRVRRFTKLNVRGCFVTEPWDGMQDWLNATAKDISQEWSKCRILVERERTSSDVLGS